MEQDEINVFLDQENPALVGVVATTRADGHRTSCPSGTGDGHSRCGCGPMKSASGYATCAGTRGSPSRCRSRSGPSAPSPCAVRPRSAPPTPRMRLPPHHPPLPDGRRTRRVRCRVVAPPLDRKHPPGGHPGLDPGGIAAWSQGRERPDAVSDDARGACRRCRGRGSRTRADAGVQVELHGHAAWPRRWAYVRFSSRKMSSWPTSM